MIKKFFTLLLTLAISFNLFSAPEMISDPFPIEKELESFNFKNTKYPKDFLDNSYINLITVEPGKEIFSYFGHTALEIITPHFSPIFFDTGIFSYTNTFVKDLLQGKLFFGAYRSYANYNRESYEMQNREVTTLPLNLDNDNKAGIIDFTAYHAMDENHIYLYDYYFDNCATRIRDIINKATDGKLKEVGDKIDEGTTFRKLTTQYMKKAWPINFTFNYLEGPTLDRPITRYEAAFIPERLNTLVSDYQSGIISEKKYPLFSSTIALALESFTISVIIALALYLMLKSKGKIIKRISHFFAFLIELYLALLASVLFYMQNFSYHQVTYQNENLFIISPLIIILAIEHLICTFKLSYKSKIATFTLYLSIFSSSLALAFKGIFMDTFTQDNFYVFAFIAPLFVYEAVRGKKQKQIEKKDDKYFYYL